MKEDSAEVSLPEIQVKSEMEIKVEPPEECIISGVPETVKSEQVTCDTVEFVNIKEEPEEVECGIETQVVSNEATSDVTEKHEPVSDNEDDSTTTWCPESVDIPFDPFGLKTESEEEDSENQKQILVNAYKNTGGTSTGKSTSASTSKDKSKKKKKETETPAHGDSGMHSCLLCPLEFRQEINLQQHVAWVHFGDRFHSCPHCGRRFFEVSKLSKHMKSTHKADTIVTCNVCKLKFNGKYLLDCHTILEHPPITSTRTISRNKDKTNMIVEDKVIDRSRVAVIAGPVIKKFKPNDSDDSCSNEGENLSVDPLAMDTTPIAGPSKVNCNPKITLSSSMTASKTKPSVDDSRKVVYLCPECDKPFTDKDLLQKHATIHEKVKPLECSKCWKWFLYPEELNKHLSQCNCK